MFDLHTDHRSTLLRLAAQAPTDGALALDPTDPEQHALIAQVLEASNKGPERYPELHRALDDARRGVPGMASSNQLDDCTVVDLGKDAAGRATARGWLASRGGAYISGVTTLVHGAASNELLAEGTATQVGGSLAQSATVSKEAKPATSELRAVSIFHVQQSPDTPPRFGMVARSAAEEEEFPIVVTAPVPRTGPKAVRIGLCRMPGFEADVDYAYPSSQNVEPDRLVCPLVASAALPYKIDTSKPLLLQTKVYVKTAAAWLLLRPGFNPQAGAKVLGEYEVKLDYPFDKKPIFETQSLQYGVLAQANDKLSAFYYQCTVPLIGLPKTVTFTICSRDTPEEPSLNCKQIENLEYVWHCLGADTLVTLADGSQRPIAELDNSVSVRTGDGTRSLRCRRPIVRSTPTTKGANRRCGSSPRVAARCCCRAGIRSSPPRVRRRERSERRGRRAERHRRGPRTDVHNGVLRGPCLQPARRRGRRRLRLLSGHDILVGDQLALAAHAQALRHDADYMLARLPESHHQDFLSALADAPPLRRGTTGGGAMEIPSLSEVRYVDPWGTVAPKTPHTGVLVNVGNPDKAPPGYILIARLLQGVAPLAYGLGGSAEFAFVAPPGPLAIALPYLVQVQWAPSGTEPANADWSGTGVVTAPVLTLGLTLTAGAIGAGKATFSWAAAGPAQPTNGVVQVLDVAAERFVASLIGSGGAGSTTFAPVAGKTYAAYVQAAALIAPGIPEAFTLAAPRRRSRSRSRLRTLTAITYDGEQLNVTWTPPRLRGAGPVVTTTSYALMLNAGGAALASVDAQAGGGVATIDPAALGTAPTVAGAVS